MTDTKTPISECQDCGKTWSEDQLNPIKDIEQRVASGEPMPSGECPECGALCQERPIIDKDAPITREITKRTAQFFLDEPMTTWSTVGELTPEFQHAMIRYLDGEIERAARLRGYLDERYGHGCGDHGHKDGVKSSNKLAAKIRKALGFTYAKDDVRF